MVWHCEDSLGRNSLEAADCTALAPALRELTALQKLMYVWCCVGWLRFAV